jgi:lysophospholipase L1-like esterase
VVQAIGDSVMLGAAENLAARGVVVDAAQSRQMRDYVPTVQALAAQGLLGDVVVVHLGTNGSFSEETMTAFFDALVSVPRVFVMTIHADRGYTQRNNELIASLPGRYPNVTVIDWSALVASCDGNCLYADGIHLPPAGRRFYADLIFQAIGA